MALSPPMEFSQLYCPPYTYMVENGCEVLIFQVDIIQLYIWKGSQDSPRAEIFKLWSADPWGSWRDISDCHPDQGGK